MLFVYSLFLCLHLLALGLQKGRFLESEDQPETGEAGQQWTFTVFGCTWLLGMAVPFFSSAPFPLSDDICLALGASAFASGFTVRVMAYRNMGKMFTYDLGLRKGHALVTSGIHGVVRHPGYVGTLLMHMGLGLISTSWLAMLLTVGSIAIVLQIRVRREETLLKTQFGSIWEAYAQQTGRWIPQV